MDLIKKLAEEYIHRTDKPTKYVIEPNTGLRCSISKVGTTVKILYNNIDITEKLPTLTKSILNCINVDIILDGFLTDKDITFETLFDTTTLQFRISDILYYNKDIKNLPWCDRHKYVTKLTNFVNLKPTPTHIVTNKKETKEVCDFFLTQEGISSVLIKNYDSLYSSDVEILSYK